jgi:two-component system sensor histidine kinase UhpB
MRKLVGERDVRSVRAAANALSEQLNHRRTAILSLARQPEVDSDIEALSGIFHKFDFLLADFDKGLAFYDQQTGLLAFQGEDDLWKDLDPALLLGNTGEMVSTDSTNFVSISDPTSGETIILGLRPPTAVCSGAFSPSHLIDKVLGDVFSSSEGGYAFVVDRQRRLLYQMGSNTTSNENAADHPGVAEAMRGESGSTYVNVGDSEHVVAYSPIAQLDWALVIEEPWEMLASPSLRTTEYAPLVLIPVLILALVALWFVSRSIVQPLRSLEAKASALGWGNFEAIEAPVGGVAEIRHLQTELISLAQKVKAAQQGLRGYIGVMTRGLEEERRRLARELHDETLQSLIALNQRVQLTRLSMNGAANMESLDEIQRITENTIQELRRVARALRPLYLEDLGLVAALEMLAREIQQVHDLETHFQSNGVEQRLSPEAELALYRVVQECLNNVVRHANASHAFVNISFSPTEVAVEVRDKQRVLVPESLSSAPAGHYGCCSRTLS